MSDKIEHNGKTYVEIGYLEMANNTAKRRGQERAALRSQLAAANEERDRLRGALAQARVSLMEHRCGTGSCHCCRSIWAIDAALSSSPSVLPGVLEALEEAGEELTLIWAQSNPAYCNPDYTPPANTLIGRIREAATSLRTLLGRQS